MLSLVQPWLTRTASFVDHQGRSEKYATSATPTSKIRGRHFVVILERKETQSQPSDWRPGGRGFNPRRGRQHSFVEIDHEIFSTVILSLPLIQEGQLSVSGKRMCTILVNRLED